MHTVLLCLVLLWLHYQFLPWCHSDNSEEYGEHDMHQITTAYQEVGDVWIILKMRGYVYGLILHWFGVDLEFL